MSLSKQVCILSAIAVFNFASPQAEAFADRETVKSELINNCKRLPKSCRDFVAAELALATQLGRNPEGLALALGLADAIAAIGQFNSALSLQLATLIAERGPAFVQSAVAAAIGNAPSSPLNSGGSAGSAG
jgi:hypothetical protein